MSFIRFQNAEIANAAQLKAGVAKINITILEVGGLARDSVYARALVLEYGPLTAVIISIDVLAVKPYIYSVRFMLQKELNIDPSNDLINASQLHTARPACSDIQKRIVSAVKKLGEPKSLSMLEQVQDEDRIMENRRLRLTNWK